MNVEEKIRRDNYFCKSEKSKKKVKKNFFTTAIDLLIRWKTKCTINQTTFYCFQFYSFSVSQIFFFSRENLFFFFEISPIKVNIGVQLSLNKVRVTKGFLLQSCCHFNQGFFSDNFKYIVCNFANNFRTRIIIFVLES